jgi:hypothetical protein
MRSQLLADLAVIVHRRIEELAVIFGRMDVGFNMLGLKFFGEKQWCNTKKKFPQILKPRVFRVFVPHPYGQATVRVERLN